MKVLAIDSSGLVASIAILEEDNLIAEYTIHYKKTHSQTLMPMLNEVANMIELDLQTIDVIAIAAGPGSFTGLRIGSATAKGLGLALKKEIVGIPTVDGLAFNLYGTDKVICPIMDARRGQVYTGIYEFLQKSTSPDNVCQEREEYKLIPIHKQCAVMLEDVVVLLNELNREVIFLGDGVPVFKEKLSQIMTVPYSFALAGMNRQKASSIGTLGLIAYKEGAAEKALEYKPTYLRLSQAERELMEKEKLIADSVK